MRPLYSPKRKPIEINEINENSQINKVNQIKYYKVIFGIQIVLILSYYLYNLF